MNETLTTLIEELHHPDKSVRGQAAIKLGTWSDSESLQMLLQALARETDLYVREDLTWSLVRRSEAAIMPLIQLLSDPNPAIRHHAAHVLGKIGDPRAVDPLITVLGDQDQDTAVITKAAFALGQIGDTRAIPALMNLLGHSEREVQTTIVNVTETFGVDAVAPLLNVLQHERWQVREQAADILGLVGDQAITPALIVALEDEHWKVRFAIVAALGSIGGSTAKAALQKMQTDSDARVRELAQKCSGRVKA
ncbi:MAG: HEAT repeat domain-containing protein [Chloroflexota bacterium]